MISKKKLTKITLLLLSFLLVIPFAIPVKANEINTVEMWVVIHNDGSATIKETWDISIDDSSNTEWYVAKHNLDNMQIRDLLVEEVTNDEVITFETLKHWDVKASRNEKAGRCGLVETNGGYEVCWGFGEMGRHQYNVTYTITNIVKGYKGGDAMSYNFLSDAAGGANTLNIFLRADDFDFIYPDTRVWVFGYEAQSSFTDGGISVLNDGRFSKNDYASILLVFEPDQLSPADQRSDSIDKIINRGLEGSIWEDENISSNDGSADNINKAFIWCTQSFIFIIIIITMRLIRKSATKKAVGGKENKRLYKNVDYCREIPFGGDIIAAYARLDSLGGMPDGRLIGCYLLKWMRTGQVSIITERVGIIIKRDEESIQLNQNHTDMSDLERQLYNMVCAAAGGDNVLQTKEFEKWSRKKYNVISSWFSICRRTGDRSLVTMGAYTEVPVKRLFGLINTTKRIVSAEGEKLTQNMFGFKRYLEDFTIINEREARTVELWEDYLIFAQLFGIADKVMTQFQQLYPDYFDQPDLEGGYYHSRDILTVLAVSDSFAGAMARGYQYGQSASSSSSGGGGGSSSFGGGGGSSGGGGAGGR